MRRRLLLILLVLLYNSCLSQTADKPVSTPEDALHYIETISIPENSQYWPHIHGAAFVKNVKNNIQHPFDLYEGTNTNFCGYASLSYILLHNDPLLYARFMLSLYLNGHGIWLKLKFRPSMAIKEEAGRLRFKGSLDIHPADQVWFLVLADHFKGYLNLFDHHYDPGNENTFWAAVNYSKFNNMIREMSDYKVTARGSDLLRPWIEDLYDYIANAMEDGIVVLYLNNTVLHKKNHNRVRTAIPTHYVILLNMHKTPEGLVSITYWDYGYRSLREVSPAFLKKIIFGISQCRKSIKTHE